tara:strand:- start:154 stop:339 length:186 start_codon:yes stop_codon:yes gene_type:complete
VITATTAFLIFLTTIVVVELTDGKPAKPVEPSNMKNQIEISNPYPIQDTPQQDTFNNQRPN